MNLAHAHLHSTRRERGGKTNRRKMKTSQRKPCIMPVVLSFAMYFYSYGAVLPVAAVLCEDSPSASWPWYRWYRSTGRPGSCIKSPPVSSPACLGRDCLFESAETTFISLTGSRDIAPSNPCCPALLAAPSPRRFVPYDKSRPVAIPIVGPDALPLPLAAAEDGALFHER